MTDSDIEVNMSPTNRDRENNPKILQEIEAATNLQPGGYNQRVGFINRPVAHIVGCPNAGQPSSVGRSEPHPSYCPPVIYSPRTRVRYEI